ncbi:hypothetical protein G4V62_07990 [Bacillaceae bacterium SIJ1]|uniref:hypothetical protein n=1 Tax=Litoribacterium kuwaitense TaxID=1398745 RepID=UPI0013ED9F10|nr:hypothetical protein [Litoribacterium kuwaitense]NGP44902.1 hypothetical protein [Litoribacterium kuwaitense]
MRSEKYLETLKRANPLERHVQQFEKQLAQTDAMNEEGTKERYLEFAEARIRQFSPDQNDQGAIIDVSDGLEHEYTTACYAMAGAILLSVGRCHDLESSIKLAMDWACHCLAENKVPDNHADFVTHMVMQGYRILRHTTNSERVNGWKNDLEKVIPEQTYTQVERNVPLKQTRNWTTYGVQRLLRLVSVCQFLKRTEWMKPIYK